MTLSSLIEAATGAPIQAAGAFAQTGKRSAPGSTGPLFGDIKGFAARLEALLGQSATSAVHVSVTTTIPSSPPSLTEEPAASSTAPDTGARRDAAPNLPDDVAPAPSAASPVSESVTPARNADTTHPNRIHPRDNATALRTSHRPLTLQALAVASTAACPLAIPPAVQVAASPAPQPFDLLHASANNRADLSAQNLQAASSPAFGQPLPATLALDPSNFDRPIAAIPSGSGQASEISTLPLWSDESAAADSSPSATANAGTFGDAPQRANIDAPRAFATDAPAASLHITETGQPPSSPASAFHRAAAPLPDSPTHPHLVSTSVPGNPAALRESPISDMAVQAPATPLTNSHTGIPASAAPYPPAPGATSEIEPLATAPAPQLQAQPPQPGPANRVPITAPQSPTLSAEGAPAVQSAAAQSTATTNLKAQSAAFHSSTHSADPGAVLNTITAPLSAAPVVDRYSAQSAPPAVAASLSPQRTFAALDASTPPPATLFTNAGARHAEAGYLDPSLGWVGVRAEVSGGALHAAVVPASSQAAEILGAHLPALHAYVSQQHGLESTIDISWQNNTNPGGGFQQSSHQDPYASAGDDPKGSAPGSTPAPLPQPDRLASFDAVGAPPPASGGRYISVLA